MLDHARVALTNKLLPDIRKHGHLDLLRLQNLRDAVRNESGIDNDRRQILTAENCERE